jgi:tRNA (guanine-N7-)-methyltransferase
MSRRNKLVKFAALDAFSNVYQHFDASHTLLTAAGGRSVDLKGQWSRGHFGNDHPLVLELACGRGEYTLALARHDQDRNFIGVDVKGARIYQGAVKALAEPLPNAVFLRSRIEFLPYFFAPGELSGIWITFPDPFPRRGRENRRLTSPPFLSRYRNLLAPGGLIHLKTDDPGLYAYTLETVDSLPWAHLLMAIPDIYAAGLPMPELAFKTYYEAMHLAEGKRIRYVRIRLDPPAAAD